MSNETSTEINMILGKAIASAAQAYNKGECCDKVIMFKDLKWGRFYQCPHCGKRYYDYKCGWCKDTGLVPYGLIIDNGLFQRVARCRCDAAFHSDEENNPTQVPKHDKLPWYFPDYAPDRRKYVGNVINLFKFEGMDDVNNYQMNFQKAIMAWEAENVNSPDLKKKSGISYHGTAPHFTNWESKYIALEQKYKGLLETTKNQGSATPQD